MTQYRAQVPWRTRGTVDPSVGVPTQANITVLPQDPILLNDAFVIVNAAQASATSGLLGPVPQGGVVSGYLVYSGGALTAWGSWTYVAASPLVAPGAFEDGSSYDNTAPLRTVVAGQRSPYVE